MRRFVVLFLVAGTAAAEPPPITRSFRSTATTTLERVVGEYPWRHHAEITAIAFSPDGRRLVTGGGERRVKLWDVASGDELATFGVAASRSNAVGASADGRLVFAASNAGNVAVWDGAGGPVLLPHGAAVLDVAWAGGKLASLGKDRAVKLWDPRATTPAATVALPAAGCALAADRVALVDGSVVELATQRRAGGPLAVERCALDARWRVAVAGGDLYALDLPRGAEKVVARDVGPVVALAAGGGRALVAGADGRVRAFDLAAARLLLDAPAHRAAITSAAVAPDGRTAATASRDYSFRLWDLERGAARPRADGAAVLAVAFDDEALVTAAADGTLRRGGTLAATYRGAIWSVAAAGGVVATAGDDGAVRAAGAILGHHPGGATAVALAPDGGHLLSAGLDGRAVLWDVARRHHVGEAHAGAPFLCAALSPHLVAAAGDDTGHVLLFHRSHSARLAGHAGPVLAAAFSPDGRTLVTGGDDHTLRFWDVTTHRSEPVAEHQAAVVAVTFCGDHLLSASKDGRIVVWDRDRRPVDRVEIAASDDRPLALACAPGARGFVAGTARGVVLVFTFR